MTDRGTPPAGAPGRHEEAGRRTLGATFTRTSARASPVDWAFLATARERPAPRKGRGPFASCFSRKRAGWRPFISPYRAPADNASRKGAGRRCRGGGITRISGHQMRAGLDQPVSECAMIGGSSVLKSAGEPECGEACQASSRAALKVVSATRQGRSLCAGP